MLVAEQLSKRFPPNVQALHDVSFTVPNGSLCALVGHNGAGKTTLMHCFLDFVRPDGGHAAIDDVVVAQRPIAARRHVAFLAEQVGAYPNLTGRENVRFFVRLAGRGRFDAREAGDALARAGVPAPAIDRTARTYSKGMRQKIGLAVATAIGAQNLILDEPTTGLDPRSAEDLVALLQERRNAGCAILVSSHDVERFTRIADSIVRLAAGRATESAP